MRYVVVLAIGLLAGWFGHELLVKPATPRAEPARPVAQAPAPLAAEPVPLPQAPSLPHEEEKVHAEEEEPASAAADPEADRLRELVLTQMKQWKAIAGMQAKQRAEGLLANLPFDAEREKRIQELLQKEAELQAERAALMMLGEEEMDPNAFQWFMGMPSELSPRLEGELATFLNDGEIQVLRAEVKRAHDRHMTDMADMQIGMMAIRDLSDDQKTRMREVFVGKDVVTEQFARFGEMAAALPGAAHHLIVTRTLEEAYGPVLRYFDPRARLITIEDAATDADGDHIVIKTNGQRIIVQAYENGLPIAAHGCTP